MDSPETKPLVCPSHTTHYTVMVIVGMVIGAIASYAYLTMRPVDEANTYQAGFNAAKKLVEESSIAPMLQTPSDVRFLVGTVVKIDSKRIAFKVATANPFESKELSERVAIVSADTKITKLSQKDPKVFQAEIDAFLKTPQKSGTQPAQPPVPFTQTSVKLESIAVGDSITVFAVENIKSMKEFTATEIQIQPKLVAMPVSAQW